MQRSKRYQFLEHIFYATKFYYIFKDVAGLAWHVEHLSCAANGKTLLTAA